PSAPRHACRDRGSSRGSAGQPAAPPARRPRRRPWHSGPAGRRGSRFRHSWQSFLPNGVGEGSATADGGVMVSSPTPPSPSDGDTSPAELGRWMISKLLELIDEAGDDAEPLIPEGRIGRIETKRGEQLLVSLDAARLQHVEILRLEVGLAGLVGGIERVHQAI